MATRVIFHPEGFAAIERVIVNVGAGVTDAVANDARKEAPKKTGEMASTIRWMRTGVWSWSVFVGTDHWHYQEYGTLGRDPVIRPRVKKALWWQGLQSPIAMVRAHPGNKAQPFMRPAVYQRRFIQVLPNGTVAVSR